MKRGQYLLSLLGTVAVLPLRGQSAPPPVATAQAPLALRGVTVIDVETGQQRPNQTVVIVGNRIQTLGAAAAVPVPANARVVDARGQYLIPGLWDMHTHAGHSTALFYPLFLANGVTGIRDAGSPVPLDTLRRWRREILAGTRVGPPRQVLSGQSIGQLDNVPGQQGTECLRVEQQSLQTCVADTADARQYVDSIRAAGADMIKPRDVDRAVYFAIAAEARRLGVPFGGHIDEVTAQEATDSGARIIDHLYASLVAMYGDQPAWDAAEVDSTQDLNFRCWSAEARIERCRSLAERMRRQDTWWVPTLVQFDGGDSIGYAIVERLRHRVRAYWADSVRNPFVLQGAEPLWPTARSSSSANTSGPMTVVRRAGVPLLAGTDVSEGPAPFSEDWNPAPGFALHAELAIYVADGLSPLEALQAATLNPAKMWHATDSLGTVAAGKLADLVLLDADPLADISNTTAIRAVIANGRYFDRAALDRLLTQARVDAQAAATGAAQVGP